VDADRSILERAGLASGLLTEEQIDQAWHVLAESLPASDFSLEEVTDEQLAEQLIALEYLNRWQGEQLRQGRTKFTLGSYRILDAIGHGGMGWVFKGKHVLLGRIEAIKVLPTTQTNPTSITNFLREIRAQAKLDHPNLVRLSYADTDGETYFLVTEFVPGSDLRRLVHYHGPLPQAKAALLISQAASALEYAHDQGLIHRDVKPGNILITPSGHTKLTDLGLAFFAEEQEDYSQLKPKHMVGTADFLAPEIIVTPNEVRSISDIYSLGCTLYYAVTGKVPFPGGETSDKLRRQLGEVPISPQRLSPGIDSAFAEVIAAMMEKRPEDRVATATEVVTLLQPWVPSGESTHWQEIDELVGQPSELHYDGATLAETVPLVPGSRPKRQSPQETPVQRETEMQKQPKIREAIAVEPLGRSTTAFVALAVTITLVVIGFVLSWL